MSESYNYIAFANREMVEGDVADVEMIRRRMFEYTPTDLQKRLETLEEGSLRFIESLPTFLCSEIGRAGGGITMVVKFGRVANIAPGQKTVSATFETLVEFGEVQFTSIDQAREIFEFDRFQLYRTHWAVREGNIQEILEQLAAISPQPNGAVVAHSHSDAAINSVEPPPRAKKIIGTADSVEKFLKLLYNLPPKNGAETFFRGHSKSEYELVPSLFRRSRDGAWEFMPHEDRLCKELLIAHYDDFQSDQYCFDRLVRMQHYKLPTRLLDISENPLIALYFACASSQKIKGEVIIFQVQADKIKYYDSDTVSCLSNLSKLTFNQKSDVNLSLDMVEFNETPIGGKLLHHIRSEKGFLTGVLCQMTWVQSFV